MPGATQDVCVSYASCVLGTGPSIPFKPSELTLPTLLLKTIRDQTSRDMSCVPPRYPTIQTFRLISQTRHQLSHAFCLSIVPSSPPRSGTTWAEFARKVLNFCGDQSFGKDVGYHFFSRAVDEP